MSAVHFRALALEDVRALAKGESLVEETPWTRQDFEDVLTQGWWAVVGEVPSGEIVSWAVMRVVLDEAELLTIGVMPSAQRQGIGEATLRELMSRLVDEKIARCFLEVRESNLRAQRLYAKIGFQVVGRRRDYYRHGEGREDAILMRWGEE